MADENENRSKAALLKEFLVNPSSIGAIKIAKESGMSLKEISKALDEAIATVLNEANPQKKQKLEDLQQAKVELQKGQHKP